MTERVRCLHTLEHCSATTDLFVCVELLDNQLESSEGGGGGSPFTETLHRDRQTDRQTDRHTPFY
jgi:hypothetical protein